MMGLGMAAGAFILDEGRVVTDGWTLPSSVHPAHAESPRSRGARDIRRRMGPRKRRHRQPSTRRPLQRNFTPSVCGGLAAVDHEKNARLSGGGRLVCDMST
jgi:hypothetical protein